MSKLNKYKEVNRELINFLDANDNYIDSLEDRVECLEGIVNDLDKENDNLTEYTEELEDEAGEMFKYIEGLEFQLDQANAELTEMKTLAKKDFVDSMTDGQVSLDKKVSMSDKDINDWNTYCNAKPISKQQLIDEAIDDAIQESIKTRKKLTFMKFKEMLKKNPDISSHAAAEELGVTLETIIKLKCMLAA